MAETFGGGNRTALARHRENGAVRLRDRRAHPRFRQRAAARVYNMDSIDARITTTERRFGATLVDLNAGGAGLLTAQSLPLDSPVGVELQIGQYTVAVFGQVKSVMERDNQYRLGVQFVYVDQAEQELLRLLEKRRA